MNEQALFTVRPIGVDPMLEEYFQEALEAKDWQRVMSYIGDHSRMDFAFWNRKALQGLGGFEECLLMAFTMGHTRGWTRHELTHCLFGETDRAKLLAAGCALPGEFPFTVYRGIAGNGTQRRPWGLSWTGNLDLACWFACRSKLPNSRVLVGTIRAEHLFAYVNERREEEFICQPPDATPLRIAPEEMYRRWTEQERRMQAERFSLMEGFSQ